MTLTPSDDPPSQMVDDGGENPTRLPSEPPIRQKEIYIFRSEAPISSSVPIPMLMAVCSTHLSMIPMLLGKRVSKLILLELIGFTCAELSNQSSASSHIVHSPNAHISHEKKEERTWKNAAVELAAAQAEPTKKLQRMVVKKVSTRSTDLRVMCMENRRKRLDEKLDNKEAAMEAYQGVKKHHHG
eukprot:scaffold4692_cov86-Cylindrotheca_fusiformis.AAC.2